MAKILVVPAAPRMNLTEKLKSFSGIRAVANVITTATGQSLKNPFADDTANTGERLNENDPASLANPTFNKTTFGAYRAIPARASSTAQPFYRTLVSPWKAICPRFLHVASAG
jgi:hypothetical protein